MIVGYKDIDIMKLMADAEEAGDSRTSGLLGHEDFVDVIRRLLKVTRGLLTECEQMERQRDAIIRRLAISGSDVAPSPDRSDFQDQLQLTPEELQLTPLNVDRPDDASSQIQEVVSRSAWPARPPIGNV